jgi:TonB family protein
VTIRTIHILISTLLVAVVSCQAAARQGERQDETLRPLRVAVIGFARTATGRAIDGAAAPERTLAEALARDARAALIERELFQPALSGLGYDGSINLSTLDARRVGAAIGCDFFITGKAETLSRSERGRDSHEEAIVAVMIVDGRTGRLALFDLIIEKAATATTALEAANRALGARATLYLDRMLRAASARNALTYESAADESAAERVEEMPEEGSIRAAGFTPPKLINRVRPDYTEEADRADISATVEALAVFRANGEVGEIEITRWAGFGLDDAAARAIRQLKFNPATRDGLPVSVRALIRYNFRRLSSSEAQGSQPEPASAPTEKPARDLRDLFKPRYRRPRQL